MPAELTVSFLIFRDQRWLQFVREGIEQAKTDVPFVLEAVGCDPSPEVAPHCTHILRSPDPSAYFLNRVYPAWNYAVAQAKTPWVCLISSDMYVSDGWLDALWQAVQENPQCLPASCLVESGRWPSAMPEWVQDFGKTPETFRREEWRAHAASLRAAAGRVQSPGRLYGPFLLNRDVFLACGGYPPGNVGNTPGDHVLVSRLAWCGRIHTTIHASVVYHVQGGEMYDDTAV